VEERAMIIKTNCQKCGKTKAIKNKIVFAYSGTEVHIKTLSACHKCGWKPEHGVSEWAA
jgi:hypothetical protein|tara:strand:- start:1824 stop:2000 length:177 start_codon:yes stop_codon:yes gene_type:complete